MKKVLLLSPPYLKDYMRNARCDFVSLSSTQWFPILLGYCGALLEKKGYHVKFIDAPSYGLDHSETLKLIQDYAPDFIVVYTGRLSEDNDIDFTDKLASTQGVETILVGPYASINPVSTLNKSKRIKYIVKGEFDFPVLELIEGKDPSKIKNLGYKSDGMVVVNEARPHLNREQLDEFPFVTEFFSRHLDFKYYKTPSEPHPFLDILTGRGCAWGICTYCLWVHSFIPGNVYNTRSVDSVVEEFNFVSKHLPNVRSIMIQDDTMTEERGLEIAKSLIKANNKLRWSCYARGNMSYETLIAMKISGCLNLHVGYESANRHILKNIKKGLSKEMMTRFTQDAKRAGLRIHGDFAFGFPGETRETIEETIKWACQIRPHTAQFQLMIPFPGTPFYNCLKENDWIMDGTPNYQDLSKEEMEKAAKRAYKKFYISFPHFLNVLRNPYEMFLSRLPTYYRAAMYLFAGKYVR